jgi:hypothetical protein
MAKSHQRDFYCQTVIELIFQRCAVGTPGLSRADRQRGNEEQGEDLK